MLTIIICWIFLFIVIFLVGNLFLNTKLPSFFKIEGNFEWYEYFWAGLLIVFGILQIWSIFLPINIYALIFVTILACISVSFLLRKGVKLPKINFKFIICTGLILFAISYFASLSSGWPDTYGYHLNAVKWSNLYKVVPGLANLHTRLGFNSSFFLFASMVDNLFLKDRSTHVALSLMTSVLSIEYLWIFLKSKNNYQKIFILLSLPIFVDGIVRSVQVASLSYDFALLITIFAICVELISNRKESLILAGALSILLVTIKLSGAVISLVVLAYVAYQIYIKKYLSQKSALLFIILGIAIIVPYLIRNIILSGWPLYPLPFLGLNVPWAVPSDKVVGVFNVIKAWAILPGIHYLDVMNLKFVQWFPGWFQRNANMVELKIFFLSTVLFIISVFFKIINKKTIKQNTGLGVCALAGLISIFYLIFSAPDIRFGGIFFWVFFASIGSFFFNGLFKNKAKLINLLIPVSTFLIIYICWPPRLDGEIMLRSIRWEQPQTSGQVLINPTDGSPSFRVYTTEDSCGNSELPCTPEISNDFKEIVPGDISKGFTPIK